MSGQSGATPERAGAGGGAWVAGKKTTDDPRGSSAVGAVSFGLRQRSSVELASATQPLGTVNIRHWITSF